MNSTLSIAVTSATFYDFGPVNSGSTAVQATPFAIQNNGGGLTETLSLSAANSANWTLKSTAGAPGANQFALDALFSTAIPLVGDYVDTTDRLSLVSTAADGTKFANTQTGVSIAFNASVNLYTKLNAPSTSASSAPQKIVVTITASNP